MPLEDGGPLRCVVGIPNETRSGGGGRVRKISNGTWQQRATPRLPFLLLTKPPRIINLTCSHPVHCLLPFFSSSFSAKRRRERARAAAVGTLLGINATAPPRPLCCRRSPKRILSNVAFRHQIGASPLSFLPPAAVALPFVHASPCE